MILNIVGYGCPVLKKVAEPIDKDYPKLQELIDDMFETMYHADGVGLAAPQINLPIQLVTIGYRPYDEATDTFGEKVERVFINPQILEEKGEKTYFNEGCLSIPEIHEDVLRPESVVVKYFDRNFEEHTEELTGMLARIAQHEIDHLNGVVFVDHLSPIRKTLLKRKLNDVVGGKVPTRYRMKFAKKK
jgi:peptide deformylase